MSNLDLPFLRAMVSHTLRNQPISKWTVQGFGFLRTYFGPVSQPKRFRLNLWDDTFMVPNVSTIHDHPWDFSSIIVAGVFCNQRYDMVAVEPRHLAAGRETHIYTTIKTGEGGGLEKAPVTPCVLVPKRPELYGMGDIYSQRADEVHETIFTRGTVTLNERIGDTEHARVFWPAGTDWVDAIPRPAEREEVLTAVTHSLERWFQ